MYIYHEGWSRLRAPAIYLAASPSAQLVDHSSGLARASSFLFALPAASLASHAVVSTMKGPFLSLHLIA
ncbi:hypothetical protein E4U54_006912, partial [Claviceps lovelessii]